MGDRHQMEARLRASLTDIEYQRVIRQLRGAVDAVQLLALRAPDCVQHFFPQLAPATGPGIPVADDVPERARLALEGLIHELRACRTAPAAVRQAGRLRLVHSRAG